MPQPFHDQRDLHDRMSASRDRACQCRHRTRVIGQDAANQAAIDQTMVALDGTDNRRQLGANAIVAATISW